MFCFCIRLGSFLQWCFYLIRPACQRFIEVSRYIGRCSSVRKGVIDEYQRESSMSCGRWKPHGSSFLICVSADYDKHMIMMRIPVMKKYLRFSVIVPGWDCTDGSWPERRAVYKVKFEILMQHFFTKNHAHTPTHIINLEYHPKWSHQRGSAPCIMGIWALWCAVSWWCGVWRPGVLQQIIWPIVEPKRTPSKLCVFVAWSMHIQATKDD